MKAGYVSEADVSDAKRRLREQIGGMLNMLLYCMSEDPDIETIYSPPEPSRGIKIGKRTNPETIVTVGSRVGPLLCTAKKAGQQLESKYSRGRKVSTHVRKGHFHNYWIGSKAGGRPGEKRILKWVHPMLGNAGGEVNETITKARR